MGLTHESANMAVEQFFGIMATQGSPRPPTAQDPYPGRTATFRQISLIAAQRGLTVCIFPPSGIDRRHKRVRAICYSSGRGWVKQICPLPKVIYNRVANRRAESRQRVRQILGWLRQQGVLVFNPGFLDKWEVYRCLQDSPLVSAHLPETKLYAEPHQLVQMLRTWGMVYCKPRRGSLGNGISQLRLAAGWKVEVLQNGNQPLTRRTSLAGLDAVVSWARRNLKPGETCLQQGVSLATVRGRRFDIRAIVQKDAAGEWRYTGAAGRQAAAGQATTHVPRGGSHLSLDTALRVVFSGREQREEAQQALANLCQTAAQVLETDIGNMCGEFSLDVALDGAGRFWILEMNAKPFKFDEPHICRLAYRRLVDFAAFLLKQPG